MSFEIMVFALLVIILILTTMWFVWAMVSTNLTSWQDLQEEMAAPDATDTVMRLVQSPEDEDRHPHRPAARLTEGIPVHLKAHDIGEPQIPRALMVDFGTFRNLYDEANAPSISDT